jgi:hypothetical protein
MGMSTQLEGRPFKITITQIDDAEFRYDALGDWHYDDRRDEVVAQIAVPKFSRGSNYAAWLIAIHELVELFLCARQGVTQREADAFHASHQDSDEYGDELDCPYYEQHQIADAVEKLLCGAIGIRWKDYFALSSRRCEEIISARRRGAARAVSPARRGRRRRGALRG